MADPPPIVFGKYQLLSQIAQGGMAEVWKAKAHGVEGFEKILVIKRILPGFSDNPRFVEMFINEAKIAVTLSHANIVQVFDLGHAEGSYFIAMEFVAGIDLASALRRGRRSGQSVPHGVAAYIISELAKGLDYAHRRRDPKGRLLNIVHRDVSPQNILLSHEGEVKLTDFGIAKARTLAQTVTELGVVKGKYAYMAPEQLSGGAIDARADIFATGTLLYEALSGENPFQAESNYDTLKRLRTLDITPLRERAPEVPEALASVVTRAMAFEPADRYESAGELYEDLLQYLYSLERRIGGRDLATYLERLHVPGTEERPGPGERTEGLRRVFDAEPVASEAPENTAERQALAIGGQREGISEVHPVEETRVGRRPQAQPPPEPPAKPRPRERSEWREVTAMWVSLAEGEELRTSRIDAIIERYGGTTVELPSPAAGESVDLCAIFGDRNPDGKDSDNATRCGLRISRAASAAAASAGTSTSVVVGVHAGRVLVDLGGAVIEDASYRALVESASELADRAAPSQVFVNELAERALRGRFRLVSGGRERSDGFIVASERSFADAPGRFIGRRHALKAIGDALSHANRRKLSIIGLTGEAGSGKSRLLAETMRRLSLAGQDAGLHVAALTPQMKDTPFSAIQEMLRVVLGVDEFDPEALLRSRTTRLRELGLLSVEQAAVEAALGLPTRDGRHRSSSRPLRVALLRIIRKLAEDRLTIFAWDGAEYVDAESAALIGEMLLSVREARVALILSYRPGVLQRWTDLANYTEIHLTALDDEEIARLTAARLGVDEIPFELLREVSLKSGGNPLYVEEYLKALTESGALRFEEDQVLYTPEAAQVDIPKTLRGIVASRVSRLGPGARYILQVAAFAGERFKPEVVAGAAGEPLTMVTDALSRDEMRGIVRAKGQEYAFAHDLVRQVVVESVTLSARREIHAALARAITGLYPDLTNELAERLARHYEEAGDTGRAVQFLIRSADRLEREAALDNAVQLLRRAIDILLTARDSDEELVFKLYERIAALTFRGRDLQSGIEMLEPAVRRAESVGADAWTARFRMWGGKLLVAASRIEEGRRWLGQATATMGGIEDDALRRDILIATADADARSGDFSLAVEHLTRAHGLARAAHDTAGEVRCLLPLALTHARMGDHESAMGTHAEAERLADILGDPLTRCQVQRLESQIHYHARDQRASAEAAARAAETAREAGLHYEAALNAHTMGEAYLRLSDHRRAFAALRSSYEVAADRGYARLQMSNLRVLGFIDATRFGSGEGRVRVEEAARYAREHDYVWDLIQAQFLLAIIDQRRGRTREARDALQEVLRLAAQHGHRNYTEDAETALNALNAGKQLQLPL